MRTVVRRLLTTGARCGDIGRCGATAIAMVAGDSTAPAIALRLQLADAWRGVWAKFGAQERRLVALA